MRAFLLLFLALPAAAADRVVVITDSHGVGTFGAGIESWLERRAGTTYDFFASGASAPRQWVSSRFTTTCGYHRRSGEPAKARKCYPEKTPYLRELWSDQGPRASGERRVTIIAHGTNYPLSGAAAEVAVTKRLILDAFAASGACVWVGPPNMSKSPGYDAQAVADKYAIIQDAIESVAVETGNRCRLIDSRPLSQYPRKGGDGIHYHWLKNPDADSLAQGPRWAERVAAELALILK